MTALSKDSSSKEGLLQKISYAGQAICEDLSEGIQEKPGWGYLAGAVSLNGTLELMEKIGQATAPSITSAFALAAPVSLLGNGVAAFSISSALKSPDKATLGLGNKLTSSQKIKGGLIYGAVSAADIMIACLFASHTQDVDSRQMMREDASPAHIPAQVIEDQREEFCDLLATQNYFKQPYQLNIAQQCPQIILPGPG